MAQARIPVLASAVQERLQVAAIDFGTTYSGYAFSYRSDFLSDPLKIVTNQWQAGAGRAPSLKVRSFFIQSEFSVFNFFVRFYLFYIHKSDIHPTIKETLTRPSVRPFVHPPTHPPTRPIHLSIHLPTDPPIHPSTQRLTHPSFFPSIHASIGIQNNNKHAVLAFS